MSSLANWHLRVLIMVAWWLAAGALQAAGLETQTDKQGGVTVKVTPINLTAHSESWDFEIALNTHTVPLDHDMTSVSVLRVAGESLRPMSWQGSPPGGHHRKGVLRFRPPAVSPEFVELHISGIGNVEQRVFRWRLTK